MIPLALIILGVVFIAGLLAPDDDTPKKRPRKRYRSHSEPRGLPWMDPNYTKRKKREERNSSKLGF